MSASTLETDTAAESYSWLREQKRYTHTPPLPPPHPPPKHLSYETQHRPRMYTVDQNRHSKKQSIDAPKLQMSTSLKRTNELQGRRLLRAGRRSRRSRSRPDSTGGGSRSRSRLSVELLEKVREPTADGLAAGVHSAPKARRSAWRFSCVSLTPTKREASTWQTGGPTSTT